MCRPSVCAWRRPRIVMAAVGAERLIPMWPPPSDWLRHARLAAAWDNRPVAAARRAQTVLQTEPDRARDHGIGDLVQRLVLNLGAFVHHREGLGDGAARLHADHALCLRHFGDEFFPCRHSRHLPLARHRRSIDALDDLIDDDLLVVQALGSCVFIATRPPSQRVSD